MLRHFYVKKDIPPRYDVDHNNIICHTAGGIWEIQRCIESWKFDSLRGWDYLNSKENAKQYKQKTQS